MRASIAAVGAITTPQVQRLIDTVEFLWDERAQIRALLAELHPPFAGTRAVLNAMHDVLQRVNPNVVAPTPRPPRPPRPTPATGCGPCGSSP